MGIYEELQARGLVKQVTNEPEIREMVNAGKAKFYIGFDCTADSLTAGHFMALTLMKRLQMAGNQPVALIGGGTTMIGDPSGRTDMRKMLIKEGLRYGVYSGLVLTIFYMIVQKVLYYFMVHVYLYLHPTGFISWLPFVSVVTLNIVICILVVLVSGRTVLKEEIIDEIRE